jgi:hypothetical protein
VLASIAVISLHSFIRPQCRHKSVTKDADVRPFSTCIWPIDPHYITSQDTEADLIA